MGSQKNTLTETKSTMIEDTIKERTESYGDFTDNATVAQLLKDAIQMETNYPNMPPYMRESLDIICSKISRMVTGDWKHADNWLDIQGFAKLSLDRLNESRPYIYEDDNGLLGGDEDDLPTEPLSFTKWREGLGYEESSHPDYDYNLRGMCYGHSSVYGMYKEYLDARLNNDGKSTKVDES